MNGMDKHEVIKHLADNYKFIELEYNELVTYIAPSVKEHGYFAIWSPIVRKDGLAAFRINAISQQFENLIKIPDNLLVEEISDIILSAMNDGKLEFNELGFKGQSIEIFKEIN